MTSRNFRERLFYMWPAKILSLGAAILLYFFTNLFSLQNETISVPIQYVLPAGYTQAVEYTPRVRLSIRAEKDQIARLKDETFLVKADFSDHPAEGTYTAPLKLQLLNDPQNTGQTLAITLIPDEVQVTLERWTSREVPVTVSLSGKPKPGYEFGEYSAVPSQVTVFGPKSRIGSVQSVATDPINLENHDQTFATKVRVHSGDSLVGIQNLDTVEVKIALRSMAQVVIHQNVPISVLGLPANLRLEGELPRGTIQLREAKGGPDHPLRLIVDASAISQKGTYTLPVFPEISPNVEVVEFAPSQLSLVIGAGQ